MFGGINHLENTKVSRKKRGLVNVTGGGGGVHDLIHAPITCEKRTRSSHHPCYAPGGKRERGSECGGLGLDAWFEESGTDALQVSRR